MSGFKYQHLEEHCVCFFEMGGLSLLGLSAW